MRFLLFLSNKPSEIWIEPFVTSLKGVRTIPLSRRSVINNRLLTPATPLAGMGSLLPLPRWMSLLPLFGIVLCPMDVNQAVSPSPRLGGTLLRRYSGRGRHQSIGSHPQDGWA